MYRISKDNNKKRGGAGGRIAVLADLGETVFHADDVANAWGIGNANTLHMTLSRYAEKGLLYRIHKGLYALKNPADIDPRFLGLKALHAPAYVSCETALYEYGVINQRPRDITLVGNVSKRFAVLGHSFRARKLADAFLLNTTGIGMRNGARYASLPRAVADMLYFNPRKYLDAGNSTLIDWQEVERLRDAIGYTIRIPKHAL